MTGSNPWTSSIESQKAGGIGRGGWSPSNTEESWKMFDEKMIFILESSETCQKTILQNQSDFFFVGKIFQYLFGRTHNFFWKCLKSFFFLETYFFSI